MHVIVSDIHPTCVNKGVSITYCMWEGEIRICHSLHCNKISMECLHAVVIRQLPKEKKS